MSPSLLRRGEQGHRRRLLAGLGTLRHLHARCKHASDAGLFTTHPRQATQQIWITMHGYLMLELAGYVEADAKRAGAYGQAIAHAMIALGASAEDTKKAVES